MHAWQFDEYGPFDKVLNWVERPTPSISDDEALIETSAVSLNFPDLLITQGLYQNKTLVQSSYQSQGGDQIQRTFDQSYQAVSQESGTSSQNQSIRDLSKNLPATWQIQQRFTKTIP